jgi:hypothetical protein
MLIKYTRENEIIKIQDNGTLLSYLKSGELKHDTLVYDGEVEEYKKLADIDAVKELALNPEYNQYLGIDIKALNEEKIKRNAIRSTNVITTVISLILLVLGILKNIISHFVITILISTGNGSSYMLGQALGSLIGKLLIGMFIWYAIWKWTENNGKKYFLIIYSIVFLLIF